MTNNISLPLNLKCAKAKPAMPFTTSPPRTLIIEIKKLLNKDLPKFISLKISIYALKLIFVRIKVRQVKGVIYLNTSSDVLKEDTNTI
jgi:hypothetical protein